VSESTGISLSSRRRELIHARLSGRLRALGLRSFEEYCGRLGAGDRDEAIQLANAITTKVTSFFRQPTQFDYLASTVLPATLKRRASDRRIRIWSAGCASGEEPYSIGIVLREVLGDAPGWDPKVLATDLDRDALARAREGTFDPSKIEGVSPDRRVRWFSSTTGDADLEIAPEVKNLVTFRPLNLVQPWPMSGPFDVIFCRNVTTYFDEAVARALFERFAGLLDEGGHLFLGHSESLGELSDRFETVDRSAYRKCG
jgi:chemotaxis protein methyltransferase CheR